MEVRWCGQEEGREGGGHGVGGTQAGADVTSCKGREEGEMKTVILCLFYLN